MPPDKKKNEQNEQLLLTMQGHPSKKGDVPVSLFLSAYQAMSQLMHKSAERLTGKTRNIGLEFFVAKLSHNSPTQAGIEAVLSQNGDSLAHNSLARNTIVRTEGLLRDIGAGKGDDIPAAELGLIEKITKTYSKELVAEMEFQRFNGRAYSPVEVTKEFVDNLARLRQGELHCHTTVTGMVELLNLHGSPIQLNVYPDIGEPVRCTLDLSPEPDRAREKALHAIGNLVVISGKAHYRPSPNQPDIQRPYKISAKADDIKVLKFEPDAPDILDFRGAFPNLTDGKPTLEYLRELRGED